VVVRPDHPWVGRARLKPRDLAEGEWVLREAGSGTRSVFEEAMAQLGIAPDRLHIVLELPSNEAVRGAVEAGLGATAISASVAAPSLEAGLLHQASFRLPDREFHVLRHRERYFSRAADALLELVASSSAHVARRR
jgi:DNA-binding transcriptional LysR family regulator